MNKSPILPTNTIRVALLILLSLLGVFPLDVILPSFPAIAGAFRVETQSIAISISVFALGVSLSQILIGPLSDSLGRKRLLLSGLLVSSVGAMGCALAPSFEVFMIFRLLQAAGCGCFVLSHALVQDLYTGKQRNSMRILLTGASGLFISLSPLAGSALQQYFNWQGSFILFAVLSACCALIATMHLQDHTRPFKPEGLFSSYAALMRDRAFLNLTALSCLAFACHFSFIVSSPLLFMERLDLSANTFGIVFTGYGLAYVLGGVMAHWLNERINPRKQIGLGFTLILTSGGTGLTSGLMGTPSIANVLLPMIVCTLGVTIIRPAATTLALARHPRRAGAAASLNNTLLFASGGVASALIAATGNLLSVSLATFFVATGLLGFALLTRMPQSVTETALN